MKAAMMEGLATGAADPSPELVRLYRRWAQDGAGTLITGGMAVTRRSAGAMSVVLDERTDPDALARWAAAVHQHDVRLIGQLMHEGRQALRFADRHPAAPSALPPVRGNRMFGSSRALTGQEIVGLVEQFAQAAAICEAAGFDGVELHAAHGYLIGQFLSPATNLRTDEWGGDLADRARFLLQIVRRIRDQVGAGFALAVKLNASDFQPGGFDVEDSAHVVAMLGDEGVDLVEISGGTFESASGALGVRAQDAGTSKDAYFASFAPRLREMTDVPLALTGGLRSRAVMEGLLRDGAVDAIGLGRPFVQRADAAAGLLDGTTDRIELSAAPSGGMSELLWYMAQFRRLADGRGFDPDLRTRALAELILRSALQRGAATGRDAAVRVIAGSGRSLRLPGIGPG